MDQPSDNLPVLHVARPVAQQAAPASQQISLPQTAAAVATGGLVAGIAAYATVALARAGVKNAARSGVSRKLPGQKRGERMSIVGTRTLMVDIHLLSRD